MGRMREDNLSKGVEGVPGFFLDPCKSILLSLSILVGSDADIVWLPIWARTAIFGN